MDPFLIKLFNLGNVFQTELLQNLIIYGVVSTHYQQDEVLSRREQEAVGFNNMFHEISRRKNPAKVFEPVPNSKSISVLGKSKSKYYFVFQYWASLKKSLTSLTSLGQDLGNTCKLIPKSNPTFQKNSSEIFEFKKISQRATILALFFGHFPGVLKTDAGGIPN